MSLKIPVVYEVKGRKKRIFLKINTIDNEAWIQLDELIKEKWYEKYNLKGHTLFYETYDKEEKYDDEIETYGGFVNAWENRGAELIIFLEESNKPFVVERVYIPQAKPEPKQSAEDNPIIYEIKNPLVICIGISNYENFAPQLVAGCEINTEMMLKLFVNKYKYDLKLAMHNQNQNMLNLKKDDVLQKFAEARDTIIQKAGDNESKIDGLIIALSGHGYGNDIYCYDYDPTKRSKKININDIQTAFHGEKDDEYKLPDIPKIVIIDAVPPEDDEEKKEDQSVPMQMREMKNWFCFSAAGVGYTHDDGYDIDQTNEEGGFLMKAIEQVMQDPLCYGDVETQTQWPLQKIKKKIATEAWKLTNKVAKKDQIVHIQMEPMKGSVTFKKGIFSDEYRRSKYITNPVIVNIGISTYKSNKYNNLEECTNDVKTMNKLWKQYGFTHIFSNEGDGRLKCKKFWEIMKAAQSQFEKQEENHDSVIVSFSGHGDKESIWLSDYNGKKNNVSLSKLKEFFSPPNVQGKNDCPRIAIIDACRGSDDVDNKYKGNNVGVHPMQNWVTLYSNSSGYKSQNADDGGMLITAVRDVLCDVKSCCNKEWSTLQKDIGIEVEKKSQSKQCFTPEGSFNHYDLYLKPKDKGKGDPTAGSQSTNDQSSANQD